MHERDILVPSAVMTLLRRDDSVRGVADRFGVTEAQVLEWQDIFVTAGIVALTAFRTGRLRYGHDPGHGYSTSPPLTELVPEFGPLGEFNITPTSTPRPIPSVAKPVRRSRPRKRRAKK